MMVRLRPSKAEAQPAIAIDCHSMHLDRSGLKVSRRAKLSRKMATVGALPRPDAGASFAERTFRKMCFDNLEDAQLKVICPSR
jgi:hypothetical protein